MVEYGIFKQSPEMALSSDGRRALVIFFRNDNGEDLVEVVRSNPSAWYIAVDDNNRIISMEDDIEHIQISDVRIIGIDKDFGFTRGQDGTVYGKVWTGDAIVSPESLLSEDERRQQMQPLSRADYRIRMKKAGITTSVIDAAITAVADEELREDYEIIWEDGQTFGRLDPFVLVVFEYAGKTPEEADIIWEK